VNFPKRFRFRLRIYAVAAIAAELTVFGIYMTTGDGPGLWFLILENLNVILFPRIYTWMGWIIWGTLGMFLFVTFIGESIYRVAKTLTQPAAMPGTLGYRNKLVATLAVGLVIGLVIGLGLGVAISALVIGPKEVLCIVNPVQVSGTVRGAQFGSIQFVNENEAESTRYKHVAQIDGGNYSIVLSGGQTYEVYVGEPGISSAVPYSPSSVYIPLNATTFTVNFT
jgi:hypothetical protein